MEEMSSGLDPDELMDLEEPEGSELEEEDEDVLEEPLPSPFQLQLSSGPASAATSAASSPPNNDDFPLPFNLSGKPLNIKRGRGRPRREGGKPTPKPRGGGSGAPRVRRARPVGFSRGRGGGRSVRQADRSDFSLSYLTPSPDEGPIVDPETGALIFLDRPSPVCDEIPYPPEQWPSKVCAFCNLGERSQLGQGDVLRLNCPEGFNPQRAMAEQNNQTAPQIQERDPDKNPRAPVTCRRQKSFNKNRNPSVTNEYVDEFTIIGYNEPPDVSVMFEPNGQFYVHRNCAQWSHGVTKTEHCGLENVSMVVLQSSSKKCSFCNHYGASLICKAEGCSKMYHFPCATASGAFQELNTLAVYCGNHISLVANRCESALCNTCKSMGNIANLVYCSSCGTHYHGTCVGLAQLPGVRAGWQCRKCRVCQVCRMAGDETKLMTCEQCDKVYHASCQRPIVTSIPKYGWKCRCCRVCGDCGSRTPGAGLSSRWHAHYTVCDSCYQQRNKGYCCPLCHRAYRAHAHREMVQCTVCRKFVHGTCDPEADLSAYHQKKDSNPDYEYVCTCCKNLHQQPAPPSRQLSASSKRTSMDDPGELSASQESLYDDLSELDAAPIEENVRAVGLGKGKPYSAKKRLGFVTGLLKGAGKNAAGKQGFMKRQRMADFSRKRGPKAKMRGVFGVPGVGLQRPAADEKSEEEPGVENRLVLCSAKDKFVLTQDICVMCGALGTDQEGCLIACVQCGQCYHPYCVNVKVTKVILQKGWRCLDCTVCEGCGQRNDEGRLILCDECDVSYHIYCMDPPLDYVPHGNWKCGRCARCRVCGSADPGFNCAWMNSFAECGPCASHINCPSCNDPYSEGDLIIQCVQCERWLHGVCDQIKTEQDAEKCAEDGYNCILCRPRDVPPPHLIQPIAAPKPPTPTKSPEMKSNINYFVDGVYLSESGHGFIKSLSMDYHGTRKKRKKLSTVQDKEAGIMATIESVIAAGTTESSGLEDSAKLEIVDVKDEPPQEMYKEGMIWTKEDGPPPEGFTIFTMESGVSVLRRKRQRNLQKLGIGGFLVRVRGIRGGQDNDDVDTLPGQTSIDPPPTPESDKPKRKPIRRKVKCKLAETFPAYLQEAFFGKELMDGTDQKKEVDTASSDEEKEDVKYQPIKLSPEELLAVAVETAKQEKIAAEVEKQSKDTSKDGDSSGDTPKDDDEDNTEDLKDVLALPGDFLDPELVNSIINEDDEELTKNTDTLEAALGDETELGDTLGNSEHSKDTKDELSDILGSHFNLESIPNINSKDVEDIFKGVLTDESQESQESSVFSIQTNSLFGGNTTQSTPTATPVVQHPVAAAPAVRPATLPNIPSNLNSPVSFPPPSPYHSEYSNSPQFSPAFSEPPSPWVNVSNAGDGTAITPEIDSTSASTTYSQNQRSSEKMRADEGLGEEATISAVLYANTNHPEWKTEYPNWSDRYKQIIKKWRTLSQDQKAPFLQKARDNRSQLRMRKAQHDHEKIALQQKSAREAEQERQWKQLQALRQQQAQQQQHVIHEQRVQAIARVQRQISEPSGGFSQGQQSPLQASPVQGPSPATSPSPRQFVGMKSPPFPQPPPQTPTPRPPDFPPPDNTPADPYGQPPTPKPAFQPRPPPPPATVDPYAQQPATPRPQFVAPRPAVQARLEQPDINRQLRDLLQKQQFKKFDELVPGKSGQRVWPPQAEPQDPEAGNSGATSGPDCTFRQPLPPSIVKPRVPIAVGARPMMNVRLQQVDPRMQGLDPRMRLVLQQQKLNPQIIQQQQQQPQVQQFVPNALRFPTAGVRPATVEQYEQMLQRQQSHFQMDQAGPRMHLSQGSVIQRAQVQGQPAPASGVSAPAAAPASESNAPSHEQEIPDNVTAELEKLEQLHGVGDILGIDDDDELLAEMGADFNILEYADPELEALAGEKTNILDLELEDDLKEKKKDINKLPASQAQQLQQQQLKRQEQPQQQQQPRPQEPQLEPKEEPPQEQKLPLPQHVPQQIPQQPQQMMASQPQQQLQQHLPPQQQPQQQHQPVHLTPQQIYQQMVLQVRQAAAQGRPMPPGSKLQTPDGIVGVVMPNNTVQLQIPPNYQRLLMLKQQMRVGQAAAPPPRMMMANQQQQPQVMAGAIAGPASMAGPRMGLAAPPPPPPPPPPYPGPPPPYPGNVVPQAQQQAQQPQAHQQQPQAQQQQQQEQPLLLEELLEQEKREQEKQQQEVVAAPPKVEPESQLLSDRDFERLKADVFSNKAQQQQQPVWQTQQQPTTEVTTRVQMFNANLAPAPPLPPETVATEQDKQTQLVYEQWLNHQNNALGQQLRYYETEVQKLRKSRKSLNSKQRQLRKTGNQLGEADATELQKISAEQAILQKHLESSRKQSRQHGMLIQEYRNKQQAKQVVPVQSPLQQIHSPLGPPSSSPIHHPNASSQSPMMSPSASPLMQQNSPMHSPGHVVSHSPGPGAVNIMQSPGSLTGSSMSPMQPSPRIGTPHSQGDGSPGPVQSPSQVCLPPPAPRMTSPQHRRVVTSPVGYTGDLRPGTPQMRFVRTALDHAPLQQRIRIASPMQGFQQKAPGTPSPLNSPPPQQMSAQQQLMQKQLQQQQALLQQQQALENAQEANILHSQRAAQMVQQRNLIRQQQLAQQQQQAMNQPQQLTHQLLMQQQLKQQQQQQQIAQMQARLAQQNPPKSPLVGQQIMSPHSMPPSPMPPKSPMISSFGSNQQQNPNSPVARSPFHPGLSNQPPSSPMGGHGQYQPPSSPMMPRSPMIGPNQSPHGMRRPPSGNGSPAMPERPTSVENPCTPRSSYMESQMQDMQSGGGNPHNPNNPIPGPPGFGRFGYFKLGLRGGSPMWSGFGRGEKRVPTSPVPTNTTLKVDVEKPSTNEVVVPNPVVKPKKESHISRVSILKKKAPTKTNLKTLASPTINTLMDEDDSLSTPPITPPPLASTSRGVAQKTIPKPETKEDDLSLSSPTQKALDIMDYDDDTSTILSTEVSLSSAAQQNDDELEMTETLSQNDLQVLSSPLESDQMSDQMSHEFLLFQENMVVDISGGVQYSDKDEETEENYSVVIRSPTTSDDEFIMQGKTKKYSLIQHDEHLIDVGETIESTEPEEINERSPDTADEELLQGYDDQNIVIIQQPEKSPEEQISTKEDFEELIDEGSRTKEKMKQEVVSTKHISEFHKYASSVATNVYSFPPKSQNSGQATPKVPQKLPPKISVVSTPIIQDVRKESSQNNSEQQQIILSPNTKIPTGSPSQKLTSIILTHNSAVRGNILNVSPKLVTTAPAITIVSATTTQIASILPPKFTVPVISASAIRSLPNVKVIDKPSSSLSLTTHDSALPKKIFEDDSVSPDSSNCEDDKSKDSSDEKLKSDSPSDEIKSPVFPKTEVTSPKDKTENAKVTLDERPQNSVVKKVDNLVVKNILSKEESRIPNPLVTKTSPPVIIHNTPELKMTAQVIQETQSHMQITATTETVETFDDTTDGQTKSVVISIPSPTPSQEQMLDHIAMQALEHQRRDFEAFEDVLDMIENIRAEPTEILEEPPPRPKQIPECANAETKQNNEVPVSNSAEIKSTIPQLSPLSEPTEVTTNMANASQQLRTLLSSLQTTSSTPPTNAESNAKTLHHKPISASSLPNSPLVASRVIHQVNRPTTTVVTRENPSSANSVIVSNLKQKPNVPTPNIPKTNKTQMVSAPSAAQNRIQLMPDHPKLPPVTTVASSNHSVIRSQPGPVATTLQKSSVISTAATNTTSMDNKKSLTLTAMLQNQPAATPTVKSSADTITAAALLATAVSLPKTGFTAALVQAQPNPTISSVTTNSNQVTNVPNSSQNNSVITSSAFRPTSSTTNLLHTQLTKVTRTKSVDDIKDIRMDEFKSTETSVNNNDEKTLLSNIKSDFPGNKFSSLSSSILNRTEDSQNVLLKKLLQNTACASTQSPPPTQNSCASTTAPPIVSTGDTLKVSAPTLSSLLPPVVKSEPQVQVSQPQPVSQQSKPNIPRLPIRETSFVSNPSPQQTVNSSTVPTQQLHIDIKKCTPPNRTPSRDDLLSPQTPRSSCSQDSSLQTPPLVIKKEPPMLMQQNSVDFKKEIVDETSQHSEVSDHSKSDVVIKEELDSMDSSIEKMILDKEELKKQKRRMYHQKRRQNQNLNKEITNQPKKRPRKNSKIDEDYDSYIDSVLLQIRHLPPMTVSEPILNRNFGVMPVFGSGDTTKLGTKSYNPQFGDLIGNYGNANIPGYSDFYNTDPYGDEQPLPEKPPASTQRGFYDQEFPLIRFDNTEDKKFDRFCREDTPDTVISSSSPECVQFEPIQKYVGLKLISDDEEEEEEEKKTVGRSSPEVPMIRPIPLRLKPSGLFLKDSTETDEKENICKDIQAKNKMGSTPPIPLKDSGNVTVTLTLTSSAAEDIMGVLRDLANILHIPAPTSYQIVDNKNSPYNQKLGLYRTKGKDGKEGAPIDIQSILNGAAKFCKHCDVVILKNMIRKKVSDLPFLAKDSELLSEGEEMYFCSSTCYMQFGMMHRSPSVPEDKAAATIDHLSQKEFKRKRSETFDTKLDLIQKLRIKKDEQMDVSHFSSYFNDIKTGHFDEFKNQAPLKKHKNVTYKFWSPGCLQPPHKHKIPSDKEIMELLYRTGITVVPPKMPEDTRKCMFCQGNGDGVADGPARLLNFDVDKWVHLNCALWSDGVYETRNGALMNLENAIQQSLVTTCVHCNKLGATIRCFKTRCSNVYHLFCAVKDNAVFYKNKTIFCTAHVAKNDKDNELTTLSVSRRVYVNRDENRQVAAVMHHSTDTNNLLRVGSLIFLNVGQILPHQLQNFHSPNHIYPIGYKIIRFYWSMRHLNKRCRYVCSIHDSAGRPEFRILIQEPSEEDIEYKDQSPKGVWTPILEKIAQIRKTNQCLQMFPKFITGEDLFGLSEPAIVRVLESLPGIETLNDYKFKYGRNPLLELPLAINPSGAARTEPRLRNLMHWKRPHTQRTTGSSRPLFGPMPTQPTTTIGELSCPYAKQFVHSKSSQYKKMKLEWRNNVYLARSKIQGLGLYAARDLEKHTMVIEYIGEIIRTELAECREKQYEAKNRGIYMFRLDDDRVVDATLSGGLARYINHSCNPNCVAETVEIDRDLRIIIFAKRRIQRGEELAYDYKFDIEDDQHKISCMCGAPNCRKWMN